MKSEIINEAESYRDRLFGSYEAALSYTDAEFVQIFENFAFGDMIEASKLDDRTRFLVILSGLIGSQSFDGYKAMLPAALNVGLEPVAIKELIYQAAPYLGIGRVIPYLLETNQVFRQRAIKVPIKGRKNATRETHLRDGNDVQVQIFGEGMKDFWEQGPEDTAQIRYWLAENCFGDYYTRDGLAVEDRELITFCFLIGQGGCDPQATSHAKGNLNMGRTKEFLIDVAANLIPYIGYPRVLNAITCIEKAAEE